jgi:hypothetical protein
MNRLTSAKQSQVIAALVEGNSIRATGSHDGLKAAATLLDQQGHKLDLVTASLVCPLTPSTHGCFVQVFP